MLLFFANAIQLVTKEPLAPRTFAGVKRPVAMMSQQEI
jgi:hypothetical protein